MCYTATNLFKKHICSLYINACLFGIHSLFRLKVHVQVDMFTWHGVRVKAPCRSVYHSVTTSSPFIAFLDASLWWLCNTDLNMLQHGIHTPSGVELHSLFLAGHLHVDPYRHIRFIWSCENCPWYDKMQIRLHCVCLSNYS